MAVKGEQLVAMVAAVGRSRRMVMAVVAVVLRTLRVVRGGQVMMRESVEDGGGVCPPRHY